MVIDDVVADCEIESVFRRCQLKKYNALRWIGNSLLGIGASELVYMFYSAPNFADDSTAGAFLATGLITKYFAWKVGVQTRSWFYSSKD